MVGFHLSSLLSLCKGVSVSEKSPVTQDKSSRAHLPAHGNAPHSIKKGKEDAVCPITGLSAQDVETTEEPKQRHVSAASAGMLAAMEADPDITEERSALQRKVSSASDEPQAEAAVLHIEAPRVVPLNVMDGAHRATSETRLLVRSVGLQELRHFTSLFYRRCFVDQHVDKFIAQHDEPHPERFALWIAEKFGDGTPWTEERRTRPRKQMRVGRQVVDVSFDRSSAHFAAWHSPKREAHKWGEPFKIDDARVWMRLHFWAARETGIFRHHGFMDYYTRFIGHFISIYSSKAPPFTRESLRWSADPKNVELYLAAGNVMKDVIDQPLDKALAGLPVEERLYTGSRHNNPAWPYDLRPL